MSDVEDHAVYVISVAAELAGVHPQTLRIYERKGLVQPARTRGNTRRYSENDIGRLREIQELTQDQGLNLAGAALVMDLRERLQRARKRISTLEAQLEDTRREAADAVRAAHESHRRELVLYNPPAKPVRRRRGRA
jgi:MerR family transcriptional regulator/heat shock protein HspR